MRRQSENFWQLRAHIRITLAQQMKNTRNAMRLIVIANLLHCSYRSEPCTIAATRGLNVLDDGSRRSAITLMVEKGAVRDDFFSKRNFRCDAYDPAPHVPGVRNAITGFVEEHLRRQ